MQGMRAVSRAWPLFIMAQICIIVGAARSALVESMSELHQLLPLGFAMLCSLCLWLLPAGQLTITRKPQYQMWLICALSLGTALLTGLWFNTLPKQGAGGLFTPFVGQVTLALIALGIFGHVRAPGFAYCVGLALCTLSLSMPGRDILIGVMLLAVGASMLLQARDEGVRRYAEQANARRNQRAEKLLHDYEESGRGWFWETDRTGALAYISPTLERSLGAEKGALIGRKLTDLVNMGAADQHEGNRTLGYHLSSRSTFSDVAVRAAT